MGSSQPGGSEASEFSNEGFYVDLLAPGEVLTTAPDEDGYATEAVSGTSFSAPLVASAAALVISHQKIDCR